MQRGLRKVLNCIAIFIVNIMMLSACTPVHVHIDWTDFVKWDGISYERDSNEIIVPPELISERIGLVVKNAPSDVSTPNYKPEDGMAAFLPVGTEFFEIKGYDSTQYIAVLEDDEYILYKAPESESINL